MTITEKTEILDKGERRHGAKAWAALGVAALMFTAACSDGGGDTGSGSDGENAGQQTEAKAEDPKETLREALKDQESWKEQKVSMGVDASEEQMQKIVDIVSESDEDMTEQDRKSLEDALGLVREMSMVVEARSTTDAPLVDMKDLTGVDWSFTADLGKGRSVQMMEVGESEYFLRADVLDIMRALGPDGAKQADQAEETLKDIPKEQKWIAELLKGSWLGLDKALGSRFDEAVSEEAQRLEDEAGDQKPADFALDYADVEKTGDDSYVMNVKLKEMLKDNPELLESASNSSGSSAKPSASESADSSADVDETLEQMNDDTFPVTYTVKGGKVTAMEMDVMDVLDVIEPPADAEKDEIENFEKMKEAEMPISAEISDKADTLEVPKDAMEVTEKDLEAVFGSQNGSGSDF